jgi:hypothetical protein
MDDIMEYSPENLKYALICISGNINFRFVMLLINTIGMHYVNMFNS